MRTISDKTIDASTNFPGGTAVAVDERIVSYDLIGSNAVLKTYVSYHDASGDQIGEENLDVADVIDAGTIADLIAALEGEVGACDEAELIISTLNVSKIDYTTEADVRGIFKIDNETIPEFETIVGLMATEGSYSVDIDKTIVTLADQGRYNAFAGIFAIYPNQLLCMFRSGTNHLENGQIRFIYNLTPYAAWHDRETFQIPAADTDYRDAKGGILDGEKLILFTTKYKPSDNTVYSMGYFLSQALNTNDWDAYEILAMPTGIERGVTHSALIESDTPGTYYSCAYGAKNDLSQWDIWLWKVVYAAGGVTITRIPVYSGATRYNESVVFNCGGGDYVIIARSESNNALYQFYSTDGGETWGSAQITNMGDVGQTAPCIPSRPILLGSYFYHVFYNRHTGWLQVARATPAAIVASATAWTVVNYREAAFLGYPQACEVPGYTDRVYLTWAEEPGGEASSNEAQIYGRLEDFVGLF